MFMMSLRLDVVQHRLASWVSDMVTEDYGVPLDVETVDIRGINDIRLKGVLIRDLDGDTLICADEARAYLRTPELFSGKVRVNTLSIAAPDIRICRLTPDSPLNIQFLIDIIKGDKKEKSNPDLRINQISIYDGRVSYDVLSEAPDTAGLDPNHIAVEDLCCNVSLKKLRQGTMDLNIRSISGREKCGFRLDKLKGRVKMENNTLVLSDFELRTPESNILSDNIELRADSTWSDFALYGNLRSDRFVPDEIGYFADIPDKKIPPLAFDAVGFYSPDSVDLALSLAALNNSVALDASASMLNPWSRQRDGRVVVNECRVNGDVVDKLLAIAGLAGLEYDIADKLGDTSLAGEFLFKDKDVDGKLVLDCKSAKLVAGGKLYSDGRYRLDAEATDIKLESITGVEGLESCSLVAQATGNINIPEDYANVSGSIVNLAFNGYTYAPIDFEGKYASNAVTAKVVADDSNAKLQLTAKYTFDKVDMLKVALKANDIRPYELNLMSENKGQNYSFNLNGEYIDYGAGKTIINAKVDNFSMTDWTDTTFVRNFYVSDNQSGEDRLFVLTSDFAQVSLSGHFDFSTILSGVANSLTYHLPAFGGVSGTRARSGTNDFYYDIAITDTEPLTHIFGLPVTVLEPSHIKGVFNDLKNVYTVNADINKLDINGSLIRALAIDGKSNSKGLELNATVQKPVVKNAKTFNYNNVADDIVIRLNANVVQDNITGIVNWNNFKSDEVMSGILRLGAVFGRDKDGDLCLDAKIFKDNIVHKNNAWQIYEGTVTGKLDRLVVKNVGLHSEKQSLMIDGVVGKSGSDSLNLHLRNIDLTTVADLVNFRVLRLGGKVTGEASLRSVLSDLNVDGQLSIDDFSIDGANMGFCDISAAWDNDNKRINVDAGVYNPQNEKTSINGFVSLAEDSLDFMIDAHNLNLGFLDEKMQAFLVETEGVGCGKVRLFGNFKSIDFDGAVALYCSTKVKATNVKYYFTGDSITLSKGRMEFDKARLYDRYGNLGYISGALTHRNLGRWACLFNVDVNELLVYDTDNFESLPFYGTVFGTGDAVIRSDSTGFTLKANVTSAPYSQFVYDSNETSGARDNSFVDFVDKNKRKKDNVADISTEAKKVYSKTASKLTLDFMLNVNDNLELKVYTNLQTDDYISLYGKGPIHAVYNDRTGFSMKGHLDLDRGTYKFTIQDIFPKVFNIMKGSTLVFNGDPYKAQLDLKTKYLVPSASLSDLTTEVAKRKTVKVNCIMNITGSLESPDLAFDLELPEGSEEERELLASIASTPDQKNMQFVYLLGIGKFYTFDTNSNAQTNDIHTSTAVESLISNTISSQLNNMLGKIINNGNWDISGNISTSERGWNSMEVEGMLRGRLLNNRLQINGNLGYRENPIANKNVVGDFEVLWLLSPKYNWSIKAYSKTNDRYFSKTDLTTQGVGTSILFEFDSWKWWGKGKKEKKKRNGKVQQPVAVQEAIEEQPANAQEAGLVEMK